MKYKITIAALSGTLLQWYDFSLFGYLAIIIGKTFFPSQNHLASVLLSLTTFSIGFVLAPIGALIFSYIGDKYGRKKALTYSILLMAIPTFIITFIPSYHHIKIAAPILLTLARMLQGLVASSEFAGSAIFLNEHAPKNRETLMGSLTSAAYSFGFIIGALVVSILTLSFMPSWAWRLAFLFSAFGALLVLYIRNKVAETPAFLALQAESATAVPIKAIIQYKGTYITALMASYVGIITFGNYVFSVTYIYLYSHLSLAKIVFFLSCAFLLDALIEPIIALLADKIGKQKIILTGSILTLIFIYPIFMGFSSGNALLVLISLMGASLLIAISFAPVNAFLILQFPVTIRYRGFSLPWNIFISIIGGTTPLVLIGIIKLSHNIYAPIAYYFFAVLLCWLALFLYNIGNSKQS